MCCGQRSTVSNNPTTPAQPVTTWLVKDASGNQVAIKTSAIAAKLHAARIGGSVEERTA